MAAGAVPGRASARAGEGEPAPVRLPALQRRDPSRDLVRARSARPVSTPVLAPGLPEHGLVLRVLDQVVQLDVLGGQLIHLDAQPLILGGQLIHLDAQLIDLPPQVLQFLQLASLIVAALPQLLHLLGQPVHLLALGLDEPLSRRGDGRHGLSLRLVDECRRRVARPVGLGARQVRLGERAGRLGPLPSPAHPPTEGRGGDRGRGADQRRADNRGHQPPSTTRASANTARTAACTSVMVSVPGGSLATRAAAKASTEDRMPACTASSTAAVTTLETPSILDSMRANRLTVSLV